jgi:hypothetical protein
MDQATQHRIYLAVPGHNICWGTVTGVINSSSKHIVKPFNGGVGFSGQEDFNILWTDAQNAFNRGEITHFAMLHGDITPDPSQRWLDILLEEMDARGASLVSSVSPLKDNRGLTSSGICDLNDSWRPWRRFTMKEIHESLPETFDNVGAGYPDKPLLHNTGLWVCDLRKEVFRKLNERNELDLYFNFPTRAVRGLSGELEHQRESEDWLFSRDLWNRGVRDTYITRRTKLTHHGKMDFTNTKAWGEFQNGDENTADKWRDKVEDKPLSTLQIIDFELGEKCNLGHVHDACPNMSPERFSGLDTDKKLDDETIIAAAVRAYEHLGFTGLIGFHYYNEPLLQAKRLFNIAMTIQMKVPKARFLLWTNGMLIPENPGQYSIFDQIVISGYNEESARGRDRLNAAGLKCRYVPDAQLDNRLQTLEPRDKSASCMRPFLEMIFDAYGNTHLCCYDWRGQGTTGNLFTTSIDDLAAKWRESLPKIVGEKMTPDAPKVCLNCSQRQGGFQVHDESIVDRARTLKRRLHMVEK